MTREEYNLYRYIRSQFRNGNYKPVPSAVSTINVDASPDYKHKVHELYTANGFRPANISIDKHFFDDKLRIMYIPVEEYTWDGSKHNWTELYTKEELDAFAAALD